MAALSLHGRSTFLIWQVEGTLRAAGAPVATLLPGRATRLEPRLSRVDASSWHGCRWQAHHDFFNPREYASNREMLHSIEHGARNRLAARASRARAPPQPCAVSGSEGTGLFKVMTRV